MKRDDKMASPQKENGFTAICNELMDILSKAKFNGTQFRIVNCILRYTYGFQRKEHEFSLTFLSEATNTHKDQIKRELLELINKKVILVIKEAGFTSSRVLSLNKNYEEWENVLESSQGAKKPTVDEIAYPQGANPHTPQGAKKPTKKETIKENNKEKYAEFVSMTNDEYKKLIELHGELLTKKMIETLSNYKGATGKKYKSDYLAIKNWVEEKVLTKQVTKERTGVKADNTKLVRREDY